MKINLLKEKAYQPEKVEEKIYKFWQKTGYFNPDKLPSGRKKTFTIMLPPPNITGSLHMGHALNAVVQDILIRFKRMQGFKTLWLPGTDHAGIATQNVVEKELKKEGLSRFDLGPEKFIERVWQWRKKYGNLILEQFKKLGASCDWSRKVFTLDKNYSRAVLSAFLHYYKKGLIYQGKRPVNWCPRCQSSLSDLEVEYHPQTATLYYIKYPLKENSQKNIVVATSRPETMLGDSGIAVNPNDKRYKIFLGKTAILPLINREIPIIADKIVDPKFGTGALKITPAHDLKDYDVSLRHHLEIIEVIDKNAKMKNVPKKYEGLPTQEARKKIVEDLKSAGFLEKIETYQHQIPKCYRCNTILEIIPSDQWFLKMKDLAKTAIKAVESKKVKFIPKQWEKIYFDWLKNIKDWCISRQIWWGHKLPVWFCQKNPQKFFVSLKKPSKCLICLKCQPKQSDDVLDTWFSSALWPFATLGWPKKTKDLKKFYPSDVLSTARDIINLWVARMIFSGFEFLKKEPFKTVFVHQTVLTKEGKRMSKSLGTGIDPLILIKNYGADATRFGIAYQIRKVQDMRFNQENILMGKKFCNKLWNASRYVLMQIKNGDFLKNIPKKIKLKKEDKKIINSLKKTIKLTTEGIENFQFGKTAEILYHFFWHHFCDIYIEKTKKNQNALKKLILFYVLLNSLKLLHPFVPFVTEEIYQNLPLSLPEISKEKIKIKKKKKSLMIEDWPKF